MIDSEIIALYNARDEAAIRENDRAYGRLRHELALRILGDRSDAEECVSDTWLRVWNAIPPASPPSLQAFVCKIVRRIAIDRYRMGKAAKRRSDMTVALDEVAPYIAVPAEEGDPSAIRHLIEVTWARGDLDVLEKYFGNTVSASRGKPTNGEFIARMANVVKANVQRAA